MIDIWFAIFECFFISGQRLRGTVSGNQVTANMLKELLEYRILSKDLYNVIELVLEPMIKRINFYYKCMNISFIQKKVRNLYLIKYYDSLYGKLENKKNTEKRTKKCRYEQLQFYYDTSFDRNICSARAKSGRRCCNKWCEKNSVYMCSVHYKALLSKYKNFFTQEVQS
jgi:hypothetical protein